jgi:hypothetical protein
MVCPRFSPELVQGGMPFDIKRLHSQERDVAVLWIDPRS